MSFTSTIKTSFSSGAGAPLSGQFQQVTDSVEFVDVQISASTTNQAVAMGYTTANILQYYILSTQNVTIKTNSSSSPDDTVSVTANVPILYDASCVGTTNLLAHNVTAHIYITNATSSAANVSIRVATHDGP